MWHDRGVEAAMNPESRVRRGLLARTLFETLRDAGELRDGGVTYTRNIYGVTFMDGAAGVSGS
jgi:hypothetical protein